MEKHGEIRLLVLLIFHCTSASANPLPEVKVISDQHLTRTSNGDFMLETGQNFTIECHGSYPTSLAIVRRNKISSDPFVTLNIEKVVPNKSLIRDFLVSYHVTDPDFMYTGFYECFYEDNRDLRTSVYIYVQDPDQLFAPTWSPFLFLAVYHYRKRYLPCRVTDPSIQVKLIRSRDGEVRLGHAVSYDPKYGFILHYPDYFFEGQFECVATSNEGKTSTITMILRYLRQESQPQPALIPSKTDVYIGETFEMQCRVQVNRGSSIFMKWSYASNKTDSTFTAEMELPVDAGRSDRVSYTDKIRIPVLDVGYDIIVSNLTVSNATQKDEGVYICSVTTYDGKSNSISAVINIISFAVPEKTTNITIYPALRDSNKTDTIQVDTKVIPETPTNITIYPALQTVTVTWIKGFNGGYQQEFYVEIRKQIEQRWERRGPFGETFGINQSTILSGLDSGSVYLLRMFSRNKLGDSNKTYTITTETRQAQNMTQFLPYILIGVSIIVLLILTNGCTRYMLKRKQHRQQPQASPVNAEPDGVQYGPYDEIGFPADGYFEIVDPVSTNARNSLRDFAHDINLPRNCHLGVTYSSSILARNSVGESSSTSSAKECRNDNPQEQSLSCDSNYDYAKPQDEDGSYLNPYNSLQIEPQGSCHNYTEIKRTSTTGVNEVYSKGKP